MSKPTMTIASMGHPQHGKSSLMGVLATGLRREKGLEELLRAVEKKVVELNTPKLRYALVFDLPKADFALQERSLREGTPSKTFSRLPGWLGCTIAGTPAMLVDEPGHTQFLKHIVGATLRTDVGVLVLDTKAFLEDYERTTSEFGEDCFERRYGRRGQEVPFMLHLDRQRRELAARAGRHGGQKPRRQRWNPQVCATILNYMALVEIFSMPHVIVAVHQLDRAGFREEVFRHALERFEKMTAFLKLGCELSFVPTAVLAEDSANHNVTRRSQSTKWYAGPTVAEHLERIATEAPARAPGDGPLRMEVDRFALGSRRPGHWPPPRVFGRIDSGSVAKGDLVAFLPAGVEARVKDVRLRDPGTYVLEDPYWDRAAPALERAQAGTYVSLALGGKDLERVLDSRHHHWLGQIMCHPEEAPKVARRWRARVMIVPPWWCEDQMGAVNVLIGYRRIPCQLDSWQPGRDSAWWQSMVVEIAAETGVAVDTYQPGSPLGRIVIERESFMVAGGTISEILPG